MQKKTFTASATKMPYCSPVTAYEQVELTKMVCGSYSEIAKQESESEVGVKDMNREDLSESGFGDSGFNN